MVVNELAAKNDKTKNPTISPISFFEKKIQPNRNGIMIPLMSLKIKKVYLKTN
jgi:hypothetical protein